MKYPSISRILDATKDKSALEAWRLRVGEAEAERISTEAKNRGMEIDRQVEMFKDRGTCESPRIAGFLEGHTFLHHEFNVVSHKGQYKGRLDAVLQRDGLNILVDFKGSNKPKPPQFMDDYRHQLGAYFGCLTEMGIPVHAAFVVIFIDGKDEPQLYPMCPVGLEVAHWEFMRRRHESGL